MYKNIDIRDIILQENKYTDNICWIYNINQEQKWSTDSYFPNVKSASADILVQQQEQQLIFVAQPEDYILTYYTIPKEFLGYLKKNGISIPKIINFDKLEIEEKGSGILFIPFMITDNVINQVKLKGKVFGTSIEQTKKLNNKFETRFLSKQLNFNTTRGFICDNIDDLIDKYNQLKDEGFKKFVLKIKYGSSGKGLKIINKDEEFTSICKYISRRTDKINLLIEGWYENSRSLNAQLFIGQNRNEILSITEQIIDEYGVYRGTNFTPSFNKEILEEYISKINILCDELQRRGFVGILGIDSIVDGSDNIFPIIEINARFTQVSYIYSLAEKFKLDFKCVRTGFYTFSLNKEISFNKIEGYLEKKIKPSKERNYFIYTFALQKNENNFIYKIFFFLMANELKAIDEMDKVIFETPNEIIKGGRTV